jgi:CheY-like chemotaxis protein
MMRKQRLRKLDNYKKVPIIAVTAYVMAGDRERFLKYGFDSYISKPFTKEILIDVIKKCLFYK